MAGLSHGGDHVAAALQAAGADCLFTLCGGHIAPILSAAKARGLRIVDTRDEATAVFAADAQARLTGRPGVAAVTAGPGISNTITALKNAQLAQSPLILLGGAAPTALQGRGALQDIDQRPLVAPHVKRFFKLRRVADLAGAVREAWALALEGVPGPVFLECPVDLLYDEASIRGWYADAAGKGSGVADRLMRWYLNRHASRLFADHHRVQISPPATALVPQASERAVAQAAARLSRAERPLMVIGSQALLRAGQAEALADAVSRLGVPVYLSGMARGLLGRDHPLQRRHARRNALREADCVLLAGVPCDFRLDYGKHVRRSTPLIAANRSRQDATLNRRPDVLAQGDAGDFIERLAARDLPHASWGGWLEQLAERDRTREQEIDVQAARAGEYVNPLAFFRAMDVAAAADAIFVADGGDFVSTASYVLRARGPLAWLDPGAFGTLGVGAGFALGASMARPGRELWIVFGDGACGWSLAEIDSFVRQGFAVIMVVGNDAGWTQIAREQVKMLKDDVGTVLARSSYHRVAEGLGAAGLCVQRADEVQPALQQARQLAAGGQPVLLNLWLDKTEFREGSLSM
ncbi:thiamine pyrophosphate-binding protein [Inhella sp.]|uniref:thiamine pyrophosphate-binding protein n=1 Tax=Inhella sp. TaxID=1921806 RepID=UPI0035B226B9